MSSEARGRRIGLIGFGSIAEHGHLPAWQALPGVEVASVADVSEDRLERAASLIPGVELYASPAEMIAGGGLDGIDICTPPSTHADLIRAACEHGIADIVCEKPLVLTEDEYVQVARAKADSGSRVISVNNWSYSELNQQVTKILSDGAVGEVRSIELRIGRPDCALGNAGWMPRWRTDIAHAGGGIILDHGWHQFYLLLGWIRAPLRAVQAVTRTADSRHYPVEDEAFIDLTFPQARGRIELSWTAEGRTNGGLIRGTRGTITAYDDRVVVDNDNGRQAIPFQSRLSESSYHPEWFEATFRYNVLDTDRAEADRTFAEAGVLVGVICAAYRSARDEGTPYRPILELSSTSGRTEAAEMELKVGYSCGGAAAQ